jgi:hypothetical protein
MLAVQISESQVNESHWKLTKAGKCSNGNVSLRNAVFCELKGQQVFTPSRGNLHGWRSAGPPGLASQLW